MHNDSFLPVSYPVPHPNRARQILAEHPEVRGLLGHNVWTAVAIGGIVAAQAVVAALMSHCPWWAMFPAAIFFGAYANHALWVLIHECTHNLVFRGRTANRWMAIVANLPMALPLAVSFSVHHIKHHRYLNTVHHDADLPPPWELWLFRHGFFGRLTWQVLFPILQGLRTVFLEKKNQPASWSRWLWINIVVQFAVDLIVFTVLGPQALAYMALSLFFSIGPHPLGARWIQEHYVFQAGQETYDYYGLLNHVAFNIGYHNEHHDLPQIPWNRLPALKRLAPEMYDGLYAHYSWTRLWLRFLFDGNLHLSRIVRYEDAPAGPDQQTQRPAVNGADQVRRAA